MTSTDKHDLKPLLRRALAGDAEAWNDFFRELRVFLHAEVRRALGPADQGPMDHSNIVQSCLRRIWENMEGQWADNPDDPAVGRLLAWIKAIVRNRSYDAARRVARNPAAPAGDALAAVAERFPLEEARERDRRAACLARALNRLPEKQRQVVELFWFEGLPDAEIGKRLGGSPEALRVLRFRALQKLRRLMEAAHDDP